MSAVGDEIDLNRKRFLALAICIIKCKPSNVNIKSYCASIKSKYENDFKVVSNTEELRHRPVTVVDNQICFDSQAEPFSDNLIEIYNAPIDKNEKDNSKTHLKIVQSIRCIKNAIVGFKGSISSSPPSIFTELDKSQESVSNSGYKQSGSTFNERNDIEQTLLSLDSSIAVLLDYLLNSNKKEYQHHLFKYASELLGEVVDLMDEKDIHISSLNSIVDHSKDILKQLFKNDKQNIEKNELLKILYALNRSSVVIQHTLKEIYFKLEKFLEIVSADDCDKAIELNETERLDGTFYAFSITEELFKFVMKRNENVNSSFVNNTNEHEQENETELFQTLSDGWYIKRAGKTSTDSDLQKEMLDLLNKIVIHCMDSYPLISFWGMEIINKVN